DHGRAVEFVAGGDDAVFLEVWAGEDRPAGEVVEEGGEGDLARVIDRGVADGVEGAGCVHGGAGGGRAVADDEVLDGVVGAPAADGDDAEVVDVRLIVEGGVEGSVALDDGDESLVGVVAEDGVAVAAGGAGAEGDLAVVVDGG